MWCSRCQRAWYCSAQHLETVSLLFHLCGHTTDSSGGVVTFTARAVAEDPTGTEELIKRIDKHPYWTCYVLPEVVALAREMTQSDAYDNAQLAEYVSGNPGQLG